MGNLCCGGNNPKVFMMQKAKPYSDLIENFKFTETGKLGNGAFGIVYKGVCKATKMECAIKVLTKKEMEEDDVESLIREI